MNDTAAATFFDVPSQLYQWYMGCRRCEEAPLIQRSLRYKKNFRSFRSRSWNRNKKSRLRSSLPMGRVQRLKTFFSSD